MTTTGVRSARATRSLLACGVVAGPLYVVVTLVQGLTRDGFDPRVHTFNVMTTGDLGWLQRTNGLLTGVLMVLFAVGVSRVLRTGRFAAWGARLLGLYGVAIMVGGIFPSDPQPGFPAGTTPEMVRTTWHGIVHQGARGGGYLVLTMASLVIAWSFAAEGRRAWAWFTVAAVPVLGAVMLAAHNPLAPGADVTGNPMVRLVFFAPLGLTWVWAFAFATHLFTTRNTLRGAARPQ
ncbi:DUF998 domain-containing protein [Amycolatopsis rhizosphaerae]|uniref:DUF998 domain-containing protein n=1 Tax=Amycolatopsis rhizosphaerae TaxID=2053003 RepID=A0A558CIL7_9PSEU|nr:DUF998 domain-containing protein [Amycolatopsis rhizosphaerae]TVT48603.1 DUF998 domain-containing protein [Amycolatopsis rhizosphaerae]